MVPPSPNQTSSFPAQSAMGYGLAYVPAANLLPAADITDSKSLLKESSATKLALKLARYSYFGMISCPDQRCPGEKTNVVEMNKN